MDELGPHEAEARAFRAMVLAAVEGETPILGVLQQADSPFLAQIAAHPQVELVEITAETRSALARQLRLPGSR